MLSRLGGHRVVRVAVVLILVLALGVAVRIALHRGPGTYKGPPAAVTWKGKIIYTAAPGQANHVTVTETGKRNDLILTYLIDDVVPIKAPKEHCAHPDADDRTKVACTVEIDEMETDPSLRFSMRLGDGDDTAVVHNRTSGFILAYNELWLGAGDDTWTGTAREAQSAYGEDGDDTLTTGTASAYGGRGDDTLHVDDSGHGGAGDDVLHGGRGDQRLYGEGGDDRLYGGRGDDQLYGGPGTDVLDGGSGKNTLKQDD
ncbi:calcium-binding protein [Streptomyces sp. MBT65]|uniref:calcium-binding protein n=1 Tax=Streptomyces sp. MBT65 TaxID=1488395 RepID=UPI001909BEE0|nr:calcium-binding protein [Streptomyces sp. MBT65]MBK3577522.1 calcium-binding protein [Streptomyces sp. MBT65]